MVEPRERRAIAEARVGKPFTNKYRLTRLLGIGGMAAVYEATHRNGKRVALKLMHSRFGDSERQRKRFLREAYVANSIEHPGVVQVFDDGMDDTGAPYLVMELLGGETLSALRKRNGGRLELDVVLDIADQLLDVLAAAHARGVIHRDIKPENLFWESSGRLRVLDFGVARSFEHVPGSTVDTQASVLGTPAFMPPEQARAHWQDVDLTSDLWAVGATLFNLVTGQFVHGDGTPNEQLGRAMSLPARSLRDLAADVPPVFIEVVDCALRYERHERWPDAGSMQRALSPLRDSTGVAPRKRVETSSEPRARTSSLFNLVTETSSFAASLVAQSGLRRNRLLLLLGLVTAVVGLRATMPTPFTPGPSAVLEARAVPGIGNAVTAAMGAAAQRRSGLGASRTPSTDSAPQRPKPATQVERQTARLTEPRQDRRPARSSHTETPQPRVADPKLEPAATGPAFLDSRF